MTTVIFPYCRANHGATESVPETISERDIHPDDVDDITFIVPPERSTSIPYSLVQPFVIGEALKYLNALEDVKDPKQIISLLQ
jgi:hypothetical protein